MTQTAVLWFLGGLFLASSVIYALLGRQLYRAGDKMTPRSMKETGGSPDRSRRMGMWVCGGVGVVLLVAAGVMTATQ